MNPISGGDGDPSPPAPGDLEVVRRFVNTLDCYRARDDLAELGDARRALRPIRERLAVGRLSLGAAELDVLRAGRAALRTGLGCSAVWGLPSPAGPATPASDPLSSRVTLHADGAGVHATATGTPTEALVGRLLLTMLLAQHDGTTARLKICANPGCQWAFWDSSRPGSARWCSMRICGGQAKARRYRERHSATADG